MNAMEIGQGGLVRMSREQREKQIVDTLAKRWIGYSTHGLARACNMAPSPYFRSLVYSMFERGLINGFEVHMKNGRNKYQWFHIYRDELHKSERLPL